MNDKDLFTALILLNFREAKASESFVWMYSFTQITVGKTLPTESIFLYRVRIKKETYKFHASEHVLDFVTNYINSMTDK